ncbi:hypothetical protein R1flu_004245 [Riccia fluitans]|uniref:Uncharacterized protein n=1 Tax=Riccia fluitans TaxID=41844 RepID=A0ABD1YQ98_9MARC
MRHPSLREPKMRHAVLVEKIPRNMKKAADWWEKWRTNILWLIWYRRNECARQRSLHRMIMKSTRISRTFFTHMEASNQDERSMRAAREDKVAAQCS